MSQVEKENLSDVLDVLLKYSKISNNSSCPFIEGLISKSFEIYTNHKNFQNPELKKWAQDSILKIFSVDTSQTQELIAAMNNLATAQVEENEM